MSEITDEEIEHIARGVLACTLPREAWTHTAHFAFAIWMQAERGGDILPAVRAAICAYNVAVGVENTDRAGYHETITAASLAVVAAHVAAHPGASNAALLAALLAGPCGRSDWIFAHWSKERLLSVEARREWTPPDLQPLPA
ncbi:hypothetical protein HPO_10507 [Hyphomonas polymorpha PS728]|uniref:Uncharacterized protein n=1 Tax=Hyphomonas polymorpha PS728 TaxID=1280954 RepID=A0A062VDE5_9PROT|nr:MULTISPECIES: hypothetical protein [Hyphomonas]KCZ98329.1 hypothetical protein HPO_10507 [Hyphomonas polymorpha PS728]